MVTETVLVTRHIIHLPIKMEDDNLAAITIKVAKRSYL